MLHIVSTLYDSYWDTDSWLNDSVDDPYCRRSTDSIDMVTDRKRTDRRASIRRSKT